MDISYFLHQFGGEAHDLRSYFAPGRVNLIGEHIDYNGGWVMPFALPQGIEALVRPNLESRTLRVASHQADAVLYIDLDAPDAFDHRPVAWHNYPLGVVRHISRYLHLPLGGADILLNSNLPMRSGLSSSAAIEVLIAYILLHLNQHLMCEDRAAIARLCQQAENDFVGVQCGIMDQFAVAAARAQHALLLNCQTLYHRQVPFATALWSIVILNTNKERALSESKYNERRAECAAALAVMRQYRPLRNLCAATQQDLARLSDPLLLRRARHAVTENRRVQNTAQALSQGKWHLVGRYLNASHLSLRDDYEVTGFELDTLVALAQQHPACMGARMTGAGFGGCAIALVETAQIDAFIEQLSVYYPQTTGLPLSVYCAAAADGVQYLGG